MTDLYYEIGRRLLHDANFRDRLGTGQAGETFSDSDEDPRDDDLPSEDPGEVIQTLRDMLSVFEPNRLPEEYGADFIENLPPTFESSEDTVDPGNLSATIFALARHDPVFRQRLRGALTKDFCVVQVFQKLQRRAQGIFRRFDRYAESGPNYDEGFVAKCADILQQIVEKVIEYMNDRLPLSASSKAEAAGVLVNILDNVCNRNRDIYVDMPWQTPRVPDDDDDRNLYIYLIRDVLDDNEDPENEHCFVVDALYRFVHEELKHHTEDLKSVLRKAVRHRASVVFLQRLEEIIKVSEVGPGLDFPTTAIPPRRLRSSSPSQSEQRESQRRRRDL